MRDRVSARGDEKRGRPGGQVGGGTRVLTLLARRSSLVTLGSKTQGAQGVPRAEKVVAQGKKGGEKSEHSPNPHHHLSCPSSVHSNSS